MAMDGRVRRMPSELASVTEHSFPFTEGEQQDGVNVIPDSPSDRLWRLLAERSDALQHPYENLETIEKLGRQLASAHEEEIKYHAFSIGIDDKLAYMEEQNAKGVDVPNLDRTTLTRRSKEIFENWEKAVERIKALDQLWMAYRNDRQKRLGDALLIYQEMSSDKDTPSGDEWRPGSKFADAIEAQTKQLDEGIKMTPYYQMQNCGASIIMRPLFTAEELTPDLQMTMETDVYSRSPITGSVWEKMQLLSVTAPFVV